MSWSKSCLQIKVAYRILILGDLFPILINLLNILIESVDGDGRDVIKVQVITPIQEKLRNELAVFIEEQIEVLLSLLHRMKVLENPLGLPQQSLFEFHVRVSEVDLSVGDVVNGAFVEAEISHRVDIVLQDLPDLLLIGLVMLSEELLEVVEDALVFELGEPEEVGRNAVQHAFSLSSLVDVEEIGDSVVEDKPREEFIQRGLGG